MPKKILLADDSVTIQKVVELTFMEGDYAVTCVSNGRAAVDKIQEDRPDILLCDVIMPEVNGYEVAAFVKRNPEYSSIPVILLTGTFEPFDEEKARTSGADTFITKPFDSGMLVEKVEELLSRRVVYIAPEATETAEIFHSRQAFFIQSSEDEKPPAPPSGQPAGPESESEFVMPEEALEPLPVSPMEETATSGEPKPPSFTPPLETAEPKAETMEEVLFEPAAEDLEASPISQEDEALFSPVADAEQAQSMEPEEAVDLGPMGPEDALMDSGFDEIVEPPAEAIPDEVVLEGAPDGGEPSAASPEVEGLETTVLSGGEAEAPAPPEPVPEIVHELTDQQEMVGEAQRILDQQAEAAIPSEPLEQASSEDVPLDALADDAFLPETEAAIEETPGEGLEVPADVQGHREPEAPTEERAPVEEGVDLPPSETASAEPFDTAEPEVVPAEPEPASPRPAAEVDEQHIRLMVGEAVRASLPDMVNDTLRQALPGALKDILEPLVKEAVDRQVRELAEAVVSTAVQKQLQVEAPEALRTAAEMALPPLVDESVGRAVAAAIPEAAKQSAKEAVQSVADQVVAKAVTQALLEATPEAVRSVAEQTVPGAVAAGVSGSLPGLVRESLTDALPKVAGDVLREMAPETLKAVAWEVIPELAESLIKRRIQELETEAG